MARACDAQGSRGHRCVIQHHDYRPRLTFTGFREILSSRAKPPRREHRAIARGDDSKEIMSAHACALFQRDKHAPPVAERLLSPADTSWAGRPHAE